MEFEQAIAKYRSRGQKLTPQRLAVLRSLAGDRSHPTAMTVVERVRRDFPFISPATVYRVLDELVAMDELLVLDLGEGGMRFDTNTTDHAHLLCEACSRLEDVEWSLPAGILPPPLRRGYAIAGARVIFRGRCPACQEVSGDGRAGGRAAPDGEGGERGE